MKSKIPVIEGCDFDHLVWERNTDNPVYAIKATGGYIYRFRFTLKEFIKFLWHGNLYLFVDMTGRRDQSGKPLSPILLTTNTPVIVKSE